MFGILYRDRRLDRGMRVVANQCEISETEIVNVLYYGIQFHPRKRAWISRQLLTRLLEVIPVEMQVAKGVNEFATR